MKAPQIIMLCLFTAAFVRAVIKDGEPDGAVSFPKVLIGLVINALLLWWGGFFR